MKTVISFIVLAILATPLIAQDARNIAGKWSVTVDGPGREGHQFPKVEMEIEQEGNKVTGNFVIPDHGDLPIEGDFIDNKLVMRATEDGYMKMELTGTLKPDGTFSGTLKSQMGDRNWKAERAGK